MKNLLLCFMVLSLLTLPFRVHSATFQVNVVVDEIDNNVGDGVCETPSGMESCSLRAAIMEANALGGTHEILLTGQIYSLTRLGEDITSVNGDLDLLNTSVTITGVGANSVIDAHANNPIFEVFAGNTLTLNKLTLTGGRAGTSSNNGGGAIQIGGSNAQLATDQVIITNNSANTGGGVFASSGSTLHFHNTLFKDNFVEDLGFTNIWGPAIYCSGCELHVTNSTFTGNDMGGKAIEVTNDGHLWMFNSTMTDNEGGGVRTSNGSATIRFSTFVSDSGQNFSHFSFDDSHVVDIGGSILQTVEGAFVDNCQAGDKPVSSGYNIISDESCEFMAVGDSQLTNPLLEDLRSNGGFAATFLPDDNSPAVDLVPISACLDTGGMSLTEDQREAIRPFNGYCDAGAVELNDDLIFSSGFEN